MRREATHWGAPFGGRSKELSLLLHLMQEGLRGELSHVAVRGAPGLGRRRLLREAFRRGPWAEWVDLSPGCTGIDLKRWAQDELVDYLQAYPDMASPSWSLAQLSRLNPRLRRYAAQPWMSSAGLHLTPEAAARAVAALAYSLAAHAPIVLHVALEPEEGTWEKAMFDALSRRLHEPGVVLVSGGMAPDPRAEPSADPPHVRSLVLEPLTVNGVEDIARQWFGDAPGRNLAPWLLRSTGGNAFALSEVLRWLEEAGLMHVDDIHGTVAPLSPADTFPVPMNLYAVMQTRWQRLTPAAQYVFHHIVRHDGRLTQEELRDTYQGRDGEQGFDQALSLLRQRAFLYRNTYRHPLAPSSTLWKAISEEPSKRRFKRVKVKAAAPALDHPPAPRSLLSHTLTALEHLRDRIRDRGAQERELVPELAGHVRLCRTRSGPAWDGAWGRACLLAAVVYERRGDDARALGWCRRGRERLNPEVFPALRRGLGTVAARVHTRRGHTEESRHVVQRLRAEALWAGHSLAARSLAPEAPPVLDRMPARLRLLGGRGVSTRHGYKPLPLFPEWWHAVLALSVSRALLEEHPEEGELAAAYQEAESRPWDVMEAVADFNRLLFVEHPGGGGLFITAAGHLRWSFKDIWCDARELMVLPESPEAFSRAGALVGGVFLPGVHHPTVERAREAIRAKLMAVLGAAADPLPAADYQAWVEGPARLIGGPAVLQAKVRRAGKPRLARALSDAPPSREA